ncbi:hypothetical protein [Ureibacillus acetophenoni]|uniref:Uncharacterized protein n=1 Tax=Ureibacillus acetophenoni TaxID=614649 RepID=A0A285URT4_9BACL|nr:hypothetical protein [Ureibacillus acetophenoni]SOC44108.1 hypothetical protein SAMN05877842_11915 [Ureibacillus acetophenoni]
MSDNLKQEIENIAIPKNLDESVLKGVQRAKLENTQNRRTSSKRHFKPFLISLLAVAVIGILLFPSIQSLDTGNEQSQGSVINENIIDGDSEVTDEMHQVISDYVINQKYNSQQTDVQFEVHKVYGTLQEGDTTTVYMWSYYNSFNKETGKEEVTGVSLPVKITLEKIDDSYEVTHYEEAQDGSLYVASIKSMFPEQYVEDALQQPENIKELLVEMQGKVDAWFDEVNKESNEETGASIFDLTSEEAKAYDEFQQDLSLEHLYGLDPINIAKLYIFAGYEGKYDMQYALYTDREEYIMWSKEEHLNIPESERGSFEIFKNIDNGTFIETSDHTGYIKYFINGDPMGFQMIKNEDGIWQVSFMPLQ